MRVSTSASASRRGRGGSLAGIIAAGGCVNGTPPPVPATCDSPRLVNGDSVVVTGTVDTTNDFHFHCGSNASARPSYVFQWKPTSSGTAVLNVRGAAAVIDTVIDVTAADCSTSLACNDDYMGVQSQVTMNVVAGRVYNVAAGTFASITRATDLVLTITVAPNAYTPGAWPDAGLTTGYGPPGDAGLYADAPDASDGAVATATCDAPHFLQGDTLSAAGNVDPNNGMRFHCGATNAPRAADVFLWKPLSSGTAVINLRGRDPSLDTVLDVTAADCATGLACNDDFQGVSSQVTMNVVAGRVYMLTAGTFTPILRAAGVELSVSVTPNVYAAGGWPDAGVGSPYLPAPDGGVDAAVLADGAFVDAVVADVPRGTCAGDPSYACPATVTCSNGTGGIITYATACGAGANGVRNVCAVAVAGSAGATAPFESAVTCLGASTSCYGPNGAVWNCPTRWVLPSGSGDPARLPNCCWWDANARTPHGECGIPTTTSSPACVAPPAMAYPER